MCFTHVLQISVLTAWDATQAKGFPDLATRRFLSMLHTIQPDLPMFVLVDYDPYGVAILRTYKYGSQRLAHENSATVPGIQWLGVRSRDVLTSSFAVNSQNSQGADSQSSGFNSSQESLALSFDGQLSEGMSHSSFLRFTLR